MKRRRPATAPRSNRDVDRLVWLANGLAESGSRIEDAFWQRELAEAVDRLLAAGQDEVLNQALDRLAEQDSPAYEDLIDLIESGVEVFSAPGPDGDAADAAVLLLAAPILLWSRYGIPAKNLGQAALDSLKVQLSAHVLAAGVELVLADVLFSPDQLPQGYAEIRQFADAFYRAAVEGHFVHVDLARLPASQSFVSDVRYLVGAVKVPAGRPIFRWNEADGSRTAALAAWQAQGGALLQALLPGCSLELLQPDAYFAAWRRADNEGRRHALTASVAYLQAVFEVPAASVHAVLAPYYDQQLVEWRVGFSLSAGGEVVYGVTWPVQGPEEAGRDMANELVALLQSAGVVDVRVLDQRMALEYCDDCGLPLVPNADGESVHPEMPEATRDAPPHLH